eukprot:3889356-Amphidinium_carterae.1
MGGEHSGLSCGASCCKIDNDVTESNSLPLVKSQRARGRLALTCTEGVSPEPAPCVLRGRLEILSKTLFLLHDLNGDGFLEEQEL